MPKKDDIEILGFTSAEPSKPADVSFGPNLSDFPTSDDIEIIGFSPTISSPEGEPYLPRGDIPAAVKTEPLGASISLPMTPAKAIEKGITNVFGKVKIEGKTPTEIKTEIGDIQKAYFKGKIKDYAAEEAYQYPWRELEDTMMGQVVNWGVRYFLKGVGLTVKGLGDVVEFPHKLVTSTLSHLLSWTTGEKITDKKSFMKVIDKIWPEFSTLKKTVTVLSAFAQAIPHIYQKAGWIDEKTATKLSHNVRWARHFAIDAMDTVFYDFLMDPLMYVGIGETGALAKTKPVFAALGTVEKDTKFLSSLNKALKSASSWEEFFQTVEPLATTPLRKEALEGLKYIASGRYADNTFLTMKALLPKGGFKIFTMTKDQLIKRGLWGLKFGNEKITPQFLSNISRRVSKAVGKALEDLLPNYVERTNLLGKIAEGFKGSKTFSEMLRPEIKEFQRRLLESREITELLRGLDKEQRNALKGALKLVGDKLAFIQEGAEADIFSLSAELADAYKQYIKALWESGAFPADKQVLKTINEAFTVYLEQPEAAKVIASKILEQTDDFLRQVYTNPETKREFFKEVYSEMVAQGVDFPLGRMLKEAEESAVEVNEKTLNKIVDMFPIFDKGTAKFITSETAERVRATLRGVLKKVWEKDTELREAEAFLKPYMDYLPHKFNYSFVKKLAGKEESFRKFLKDITRANHGFMKRRALVFPVNPLDPEVKEFGKKFLQMTDEHFQDWEKAFNSFARRTSEVLLSSPKAKAERIYRELFKLEENSKVFFPSIYQVAKRYGEKVIETNPFKVIGMRLAASRLSFLRSRLVNIVRKEFSKFPELVPDEAFMRQFLKNKGLEVEGLAGEELLNKFLEESGGLYKMSEWLSPGKPVFAPLESLAPGGYGIIDKVYNAIEPLTRDHKIHTWFFDKLWRPITSIWKTGVTLPWPGFHARNMLTDATFLMLEGMNPLNPDYYRAWRYGFYLTAQYLKKPELLKGELAHLPLGMEIAPNLTLEKLLKEAREMGIIEGGFFAGELGMGGSNWAANYIAKAPLRKLGGTFGRFREGSSRMAGYIYWRLEGYTPELAAEKVNKALFNYARPGKTIVKMRETMFPFATFYMKAFPFLVEKIWKRPAYFLAYQKAKALIYKHFHLNLDWFGNFAGRELIPLFTKKNNQGQKEVVVFSAASWSPFGVLYQGADFFNTLVNLSHPAVRLLVEESLNKRFYSKTPIERTKGEMRQLEIAPGVSIKLPTRIWYAAQSLFRGPREWYRLHRAFVPAKTSEGMTAGGRLVSVLKILFGINTIQLNPAILTERNKHKVKYEYQTEIKRQIKYLKKKISELQSEYKTASPLRKKEILRAIESYKEDIKRSREYIQGADWYIKLLDIYKRVWEKLL